MRSLEQHLRYIDLLQGKSICNSQQGTLHNHTIELGQHEPAISSRIFILAPMSLEFDFGQAIEHVSANSPLAEQILSDMKNLATAVSQGLNDMLVGTRHIADYARGHYDTLTGVLIALSDGNLDQASVNGWIMELDDTMIPAVEAWRRNQLTRISWYLRWLREFASIAHEMPWLIRRIERRARRVLQMEVAREARIRQVCELAEDVWQLLHRQLLRRS